MTDSPLTKQEVAEVVAEVVLLVHDSHKELVSTIQDATAEAVKGDGKLAGQIKEVQASLEDHKQIIEDRIKNIELTPGKNTDPEEIKQMVLDSLDLPEPVDPLELPDPDTAEELRDKLETLVGDERLDITAINGLQELLSKKEGKNGVSGGPRGVQTTVNGTKIGLVQYLDVEQGTGITVTPENKNGVLKLTVATDASTTEIPQATANPFVYTVQNVPSYIDIGDSSGYVSLYGGDKGYTLTGSTAPYTVTFANAPQSNQNLISVYAGSAPVNSVSTSDIKAWTYGQLMAFTSITRDTNEAITTASVIWPDGSTGTFTTDTASTAFPGAIDAYHVTYIPTVGSTVTLTQPLLTRDASGAVIAQPILTIS